MNSTDIHPDLAAYYRHEANQAKYFRRAGVCLAVLMSAMFLYSPPQAVFALMAQVGGEVPVAAEHRAELMQTLMRLGVDIGMYAFLPLACIVLAALGMKRLHRINSVLKSSRPIGVEAIFMFVERDDGYEPMVEVIRSVEPLPLNLPSRFRVKNPLISGHEFDVNSLVGKKLSAQGYVDPEQGVFAAIRIGELLLIGEYGDG